MYFQNTTYGINLIATKVKDDKLYCQFSRQADLDITDPNNKNKSMEFNINEKPFYIIMATGPISNGNISYHSEKKVSSKTIDFTLYNEYLIKAYAGCGDVKGGFPKMS